MSGRNGCAVPVLGTRNEFPGGTAIPADPLAESFLKALEEFACRRGAPIPVELNPQQAKPWEGDDVEASALVIVAPVAGDADATTGATALSTALIGGLSEHTVTVLTPTAVSDSVIAVSATAENGNLTIWRRLELGFHSLLAARALRVSVQLSGTAVVKEQEIVEPVLLFDLRAGEGQVVEVRFRNLDQRSAYFVAAKLSGYKYPIKQRTDRLSVERTPARDPRCRGGR